MFQWKENEIEKRTKKKSIRFKDKVKEIVVKRRYLKKKNLKSNEDDKGKKSPKPLIQEKKDEINPEVAFEMERLRQ